MTDRPKKTNQNFTETTDKSVLKKMKKVKICTYKNMYIVYMQKKCIYIYVYISLRGELCADACKAVSKLCVLISTQL